MTGDPTTPTVISPGAPAVPAAPSKPGWQTTEFWASLAPLFVFVVALFTHRQIDQGTAGAILVGVGSVAVAAYAVYRQLLKATHVKAAAAAHADVLASQPAQLVIEPSDIDAITAGVAARLTSGPVTVRQTPFTKQPASRRPASKRPAKAKAQTPAKRKATSRR